MSEVKMTLEKEMFLLLEEIYERIDGINRGQLSNEHMDRVEEIVKRARRIRVREAFRENDKDAGKIQGSQGEELGEVLQQSLENIAG